MHEFCISQGKVVTFQVWWTGW